MSPKILGYLRLSRPANVLTAIADVLCGFAISGIIAMTSEDDNTILFTILLPAAAIICSTSCLYAGGVVLNDVFDYELDVLERPERPIPSGVISLKKASIFGWTLLTIGCFFAFIASLTTGNIALFLAFLIVSYNVYSKHSVWLGPINMGACRGLNLLLGISLFGDIFEFWFLIFIPVLYIAAITLISQGEVHGNNKKMIVIAGLLYAVVVIAILSLSNWYDFEINTALPFVLLLILLIFKPLIKAYQDNNPQNIKKAVKSGVLSLIILNAAMAGGYSEWWYGILILSLLPLSIFLAKKFAIT